MNKEIEDFFISDTQANELMLEDNVAFDSKRKVLYEDTDKRSKTAKHFRLSNGNFLAVLYDRPVHKQDLSTGKYIDMYPQINQTEHIFEAITDRFKAKFPKIEGKDNFVTIEKDGRKVSWQYTPQKSSRGKKSMAVICHHSKVNPWDVENYPSFKFVKADTNVDIEYNVSDNGIKESIILSGYPGCRIFTFKLQVDGLSIKLSEDKKTIFLVRDDVDSETEMPEMRIPPAFMLDNNESFCDDIHYEIRQSENDVFLDMVLDTDWLSEPERAYPVVIDPRVELMNNSINKMRLVEVCSNNTIVSDSNSSISRRIGVDALGNIHRLYVDFDLPSLADGYKIAKAGLLFHQKDYKNYNEIIDDYVVLPVTDPTGKELSSSSFTWENVQGLTYGDTIDTLRSYYRIASTEIEIDMTKTINNWYTDNNSFHGIVIRKKNEEKCYCNNCINATYIDLYSHAADKAYRPKLYIEYTSTDMYTDHQKYHTFESGRAGTGSINLYTGKLSFAHGDVSAEGVKLPLSVSHLYRHEYVNETVNDVNKYGIGWKLSVEQTLEIVNKHGIKAVYTNAQGKRHYFVYDETNTTTEITDDAGLGLKYKEECGCICGQYTTHLITDDKGNKMTFNSSGKLVQLIDTYGNTSRLHYTNGKLTGVIDGSKHSASLYYNAQNQLERIADGEGRVIQYAYDASGDLINIKYPSADNAYSNEGELSTQFIYDSNHRLVKAIDYSGTAYTIDYDTEGRVNKLTYSGSKCVADNQVNSVTEVLDDSISFEYRAKSTAIINDRTKVKTVYKFDANGRELSSYQDMTEIDDVSMINESTPTEIAGYESIIDSTGSSKIGKYRSLSVTLNNDANDEINLIQNGFFDQTDSESMPSGWKVVGAQTGRSGISSQNYISGKKSYYFATTNYSKYLSQTVNLCNCQLNGNVLVAAAWAKANGSFIANSDASTAKFRLVLKVTYEDGGVEEYTENYDTGYDGWQYAAIPFIVNKDYRPIKVELKLDYTANTGTCYFTNVRLVSANGISTTNRYKTDNTPISTVSVFQENKNIKMMTVKKDSVLTTTDYIDDNSDVVRTSITDRNGITYSTDYKYDSKHNLIKTKDYRGLIIEYTYNAYGKELTRKTYHEDSPNAYMFSQYTYQDDNFIKTERDPRYSYNGEDLQTVYEHDTARNLLLKQTAVNGQEYNYSYDDKTDDLISLSSTTDNKTAQNRFFYTRGYLTRVAHNGFNFSFAFDELGRSKSIKVGDDASTTTLLSMSYEKSGVNDITQTTYASGEKSKVITDMFGNPTASTYTDKNGNVRTISNAAYDSVGKVKQLIDIERGIKYNYIYDAKGNVTRITETDASNGSILASNTFVFDDDERLTSKTYGAVGQTYRPIYEKKASGYIYPDNEVLGIALDGKFTDKVTKDGLRRASSKTFAIGTRTLFEESYSYLSTPKDSNTIETEMVSGITSHVYGTSANASTINYTYDKAGNIETVSNDSALVSKYYYDGLNRLKREDNHTEGKTYVWDYDIGGNLLFKKVYDLCTDVNLGTCLETKTYTYKTEGWRDRLDTYNGLSCTYDSMGNPINYLGNTLTWTKVRRLASFGNNTFAYGANGIRYRKNDIVYTLDGNKILRQTNGTQTITYYHGGSGIVGFNYNGADYYFHKNLQGDVTEIYTSAGLKVASYVYDAWGKVLAVNNYTQDNIGDINPIRYRSYYYDVETNLYYLNSRYYDPETGRFINADTTDVLENAKNDINGLNLYAYCDNNPVASRDDEGDWSFFKKLIAAVVVVAAVAVVAAAVTVATGGTGTAVLCAIGSTFVGAAKGAVIGAAVGAAAGAVTGAVQGAVEGYRETGTLEGTLRGMGKGALKGAVEGAADGFISGMMSGAVAGAMNPSFCFVAGTAVLTTLGKKAIETIRVGDAIPCVDHITGEASEKRVVTTTVNKVNRLIELDIDGETIQCTETHPFQVKGKGWIDACNLNPGDVVYTKDWNIVTVKSVNLLVLDEPVEVFNFEVEDCHTYFVGDNFLLVHNSCRSNAVKKAWKNEANNVKNGGDGITRKWTSSEKTELLTNGKVKGYVGHHMKSVSGYPDLAGKADNIQFLTRAEHFKAHKFNWQTVTHGFFEYWKP